MYLHKITASATKNFLILKVELKFLTFLVYWLGDKKNIFVTFWGGGIVSWEHPTLTGVLYTPLHLGAQATHAHQFVIVCTYNL